MSGSVRREMRARRQPAPDPMSSPFHPVAAERRLPSRSGGPVDRSMFPDNGAGYYTNGTGGAPDTGSRRLPTSGSRGAGGFRANLDSMVVRHSGSTLKAKSNGGSGVYGVRGKAAPEGNV